MLEKRDKEVRTELTHMDQEWQVYEHLKSQKEQIKEKARLVLNEQQKRYDAEVQQFRTHKAKVDGKNKSQKEIEKQLMRDIAVLKTNLAEKLGELIERGMDLDEVFYEMREDEELKFEKDFKIDV